jgi:hypothetical protein
MSAQEAMMLKEEKRENAKFTCTVCSQTFLSKRSLKKHRNDLHKVSEEQKCDETMCNK